MARRRPNTEYKKASDLINSQPGFRDIRKDPEEKVKNFLTSWLEPNGCTVYWEKDNGYNKPQFKTENSESGTCERPDLLVKRTNSSGEHVYYALEVKDASTDSNVYDSFPQLLRYAEGNLKFFIDGGNIDISGYFAANQYSISGRLFLHDTQWEEGVFSDGRKEAIIKGELPANEYKMTEEYTRLLWRMAKGLHIETRLGVLLSTSLNGANIPAPMALYSDIRGNVGFQGIEIWKR